MPPKRTPSFDSSSVAKKTKMEITFDNIHADVLSFIFIHLDYYSSLNLSSTCKEFRKYKPKKYPIYSFDPKKKPEINGLLEIFITTVCGKTSEEIAKEFPGDYTKMKSIRINACGLCSSDPEDFKRLAYGLLYIRSYFTELVSIELVHYTICSNIIISNEDYPKLEVLKFTSSLHHSEGKIYIWKPLREIELQINTKGYVPITIELNGNIEKIHGNCLVLTIYRTKEKYNDYALLLALNHNKNGKYVPPIPI